MMSIQTDPGLVKGALWGWDMPAVCWICTEGIFDSIGGTAKTVVETSSRGVFLSRD
jgi:hypothetical protein